MARYKQQLDEGLEQVAEAVLSKHIDIEKGQLVMEALEAEAVSPDLEPTRDAIFGEIGAVQFPELMMKVDSHTRFSSASLGHEPSSWEELLSVYAALLAHGTDMSPTGMALMIPHISTASISDRMAFSYSHLDQICSGMCFLANRNEPCFTRLRRSVSCQFSGSDTGI